LCIRYAQLCNQSLLRAIKRQSSTIFEGINNNLPTSPSGWALAVLGAASVGLQYELHIQKELTSPPLVYCQIGNDGDGSDKKGGSVLNDKMDRIYAKLSGKKGRSSIGQHNRETDEEEGILTRKIKPQMFLGTRGLMSSTAAYALGSNKKDDIQKTRREREVMTMAADGALIVLDWEIPLTSSQTTIDDDIDIKQSNSITKPIILLLHGMNNDSTFGYIRSMMRTATERGWIAVCMNFRGQDGDHQIKNNTPRGYNAGFTGDLRGVVQQLEHRLKKREGKGNVRRDSSSSSEEDDYVGGPIFILGYSLGANVVTKYLGEESLHGTLPKCIGGGAAMGNPLHIHSGTIRFPWNIILGAGVKRSLLQNIQSFKSHNDPGFQHAMKKAMLAPTIGKLDDAAAPYLARNDPYPPYTHRIGFKDGEEYWWDSSSHRYVAHVSVPLLKISAQDDFLVFGQFRKKLNYCMENPNVIVVKTKCGGHLGWQESPPQSKNGDKKGSGSWSDVAVADFIEALLKVREEDQKKKIGIERNMKPPPTVLSRL